MRHHFWNMEEKTVAAKKVKNFAAKADFTEEMLPNNRRSQLFDILRNRRPLLLKAALVTLAFFVPILICASFKTVCVYHFYQRYEAGAISYENLQSYLTYTDLLAALLCVPCLMVASVGVAGLNRLTHQLVFGEGILFGADYGLGIKNNAKQYLLYTFLVTMLYAMGRWLLAVYQQSVAATVLFFVGCVIAVPYFLTLLLYSNVYSSRGAELIRNVFYALVQGRFAAFGYGLVIVLPLMALSLFASGYLYLLLLALYLLLLPVISLLGNSIFADVFDETFNYVNHVQIVKKGLYISPREKELIEQRHLRSIKETGE